MGRRKISIAPIKDDRNRQVTFLKRKNGLFKKAYELGVLCSADVAVVVFNANGKLFEFHSGDMDQILLRYSHYAGPAHEKRGPDDYMNKDLDVATKSGTGGKMTSLSDEDGSDDDEDDKPRVATGSSGVRAIPQTSKGKQAIRAQAERKAKGVEAARSQSVDEGTRSESRASSFSGPSGQYLPQPPEHHHQHQHDGGGAGPQVPHDPSQHNGFAPSGALPFPFAGMPNLAPGPNGLPNLAGQLFPFSPGAGMPSFPGFPAGLPPNFPFAMPAPFGFPPQQQQAQHSPQHQHMNGTSASPHASNGVPAWFGALNPGAAGHGQPPAPHLQLLQQLGMPGWPGASMADPAAAMQAFQQQQQHLQQQHEASQRDQQQAPPPQFSSPFGPPYHMQQQNHQQQELDASPSSHPRPAPMYGTPAAMPPPPQPQPHHGTPSLPTYPPATPGSSAGGAGPDAPSSRPGSVTSMHSHARSHHSPAPQASGASHASPHVDAWQNKPRLSVAIPAESGAKEGTKPGLVTAGGASILGAGFGYGGRNGAGEAAREHEDERREGAGGDGEQDDASVPKSAFAADLLPSPFYPNQNPGASSSSSYGFMGNYGQPASTSSQHFQWPTAPPPSQAEGGAPAPPLGPDEAPDLVRRGSFSDLTSAAAAAQAGEGEGTGGVDEAREGEGGRGTKRGKEADEEVAEEELGVARGRKRRG
ncbi:uncharacterized protein RHOBADRAFT_53193, partial [Rhodotorula graminis WP1]